MDHINRNEIIRQILDCFATIDELRFENRLLRDENSRLKATEFPEGTLELGLLDEAVMKVGRAEILRKSTSSWYRPVRTYQENDDTGEVTICPQTYEDWLKEYVNKVPDEFSRNAFCEYFEPELRAVYDEEREKAIAEVRDKG